jgi:TM2 domain-containing membrane protein YozV
VVCLSRTGRHDEALRELDALQPGDDATLRAYLLHESGRDRAAIASAAEDGAEGRLLAGLFSLERGAVPEARGYFETLPDYQRDVLLERAAQMKELPRRSTAAAGIFSAVLPGAGQVYAGRSADGVVAFLINGVLIGGTVLAVNNEENVTAGALGLLSVGFYAGNIYGAVNAADHFNRDRRQAFMLQTRGMLRDQRVGLGIVPTRDGGAVALYLRF